MILSAHSADESFNMICRFIDSDDERMDRGTSQGLETARLSIYGKV